MIDDNRLKEVESSVPKYRNEMLVTKKEENKKLVDFYVKTAKMSLRTAGLLYELSGTQESKEKLVIDTDFECYLWVTVCSYYSMFYMANAALAREGIKVGDKIAQNNF